MDKKTFISELDHWLSVNHIADISEIISEYEEHFKRKTADGYTEEEISLKLGDPNEIAMQYAQVSAVSNNNSGKKLITAIGLGFADIFVFVFFVFMYALVVTFGVCGIAFVLLGFSLFAAPLLPSTFVLPYMPYFPGFVTGLAALALGTLFAILTVYSFSLTSKLLKAFLRWHKNTLNGLALPPYVIFPIVDCLKGRMLRLITVVALGIFAVTFILGYIMLSISAGSLEFWHVWHWFI